MITSLMTAKAGTGLGLSGALRLLALLMLLTLLLPLPGQAGEKHIDEALSAWAMEQSDALTGQIATLLASPGYLDLLSSESYQNEIQQVLPAWTRSLQSATPRKLVYRMPVAEKVLDHLGGPGVAAQFRGLGKEARDHVQAALPAMIVSQGMQGGKLGLMILSNATSVRQVLPEPPDFVPLLVLSVYEELAVMASFQQNRLGVTATASLVSLEVEQTLQEIAP